MNNKISFFILFLAAAIAGCGGGGRTVNTPQTSRQDYQAPQEVENINSRLISQSIPANTATPAGYLIGPADLLEIRVFESDRLTTTTRVSSRGEITIPLLNSVYVEGLTARDAEVKIENMLRDGEYIDDPHVGIFVTEHKSKVVSVLGYVNSPGVYELIGSRTLLDALASAQGLNDKAGTLVYVTRNEKDGSKNSYLVDLDELLSSQNPEANLEIKPGDLVYVPEAANVFVEGAVVNPGAYPINEGKTTLSEAVVMAGGVMSVADKGDVKLIRYLGNGRKEVVDVDLERIRNGEESDPLLNEKDAVIVGASGIKSFFYGLNFNVFGIGGVGYNPPDR
ncbi:MAG: polysaccharide biosynthesis/export family protein [Deltaproteobacteria bacterium]